MPWQSNLLKRPQHESLVSALQRSGISKWGEKGPNLSILRSKSFLRRYRHILAQSKQPRELNCSEAYVFKVLKDNRLKLKDVTSKT